MAMKPNKYFPDEDGNAEFYPRPLVVRITPEHRIEDVITNLEAEPHDGYTLNIELKQIEQRGGLKDYLVVNYIPDYNDILDQVKEKLKTLNEVLWG